MSTTHHRPSAESLGRYRGWALITGASMGLGKAFAEQIAADGVNCVLVALEQDLLDTVAADLRQRFNVDCRPVCIDLTSDDFLARIASATADIEIGILVNNAGIALTGLLAKRSPVQLARLVKLNCVAPVALTQHFLPGMLERNRGGIILVSSILGLVSAPYQATYSGSKAFVRHFGEALWGELRSTGVDVVTLCPAGIRTTMFAASGIHPDDLEFLRRLSDPPEKVAALALRNLGKRCTVMPWSTWFVNLLVRALPRTFVTRLVFYIARDRIRHGYTS